MGRVTDATRDFALIDGLKALACRLADEVDCCDDPKALPGLARQYRETMLRIDAIEGGGDGDDEVAAIIVRNRKSGSD